MILKNKKINFPSDFGYSLKTYDHDHKVYEGGIRAEDYHVGEKGEIHCDIDLIFNKSFKGQVASAKTKPNESLKPSFVQYTVGDYIIQFMHGTCSDFRPGQVVPAGSRIYAYDGSGRVTGPHVHVEITHSSDHNVRLTPTNEVLLAIKKLTSVTPTETISKSDIGGSVTNEELSEAGSVDDIVEEANPDDTLTIDGIPITTTPYKYL